MPASQICGRSLAAACCLLIACSAQKQGTEPGSGGGGSAGTQSPGEMAGSGGRSAGGRSTGGKGGKGGTAGRPSVEPAGSAGDAEGGQDDNAGAGAGGADAADAGAAGTTRELPPDAVCELDGGSCVSTPTSACESPSVTCSVKSDGVSCEFGKFGDSSAMVACGATVPVGTACCGGCGCVNVEVYYDGKYCWQGIPDCPLSDYSGKWLIPRRP